MKKAFAAIAAVLTLTACAEPPFTSDADEQLYRVIQYGGEVTTAQDAVQDGANVNGMKRGRFVSVNMVEFAAANDRDDIALTLIENGADVNYKSSIRGETLLMYCAKMCNLSLCQAVITHGADVAVRDRVRDSALEYAFRADGTHTEREVADIVDLLLNNGAEITRSTLSAALTGYSGGSNADGRYALLRRVVAALRANGETVTLPDELESAVASASEPSDRLPDATVFAASDERCKCGCECGNGG